MDLTRLFNLSVTKDEMEATLGINSAYLTELHENDEIDIETQIVSSTIYDHLLNQQIQYNLNKEAVKELCDFIKQGISDEEKSVVVSKGNPPIDGEDGYIQYHVNLATQTNVQSGQDIDFKEMMKIPIVEAGDPLVTFVAPTTGDEGINVYNQLVESKPGKKVSLKASENTKLNYEKATIYATESGQVTLTEKEIKVLPTYEVNNHLDLTVGNIDFNGSIVINGDVPEGFSLKARGDITIKGIVEGAFLDSGGSIFISEGISAIGKGQLRATLDINVGNVNQAILEAGRNIYVKQSILHSEVTARESIKCQNGHIIGGSVSGGKRVEANEIGNRMGSKTVIYLGDNKKVIEKRIYIEERMKELMDQLKKLKAIGEKFEQLKKTRELTNKERVTLLRQKRSYEKARLELSELNDEYEVFRQQNQPQEVEKHLPKVIVNGTIYPNVEINFGKYAKLIEKETSKVSVVYQDNDFSINPL
ncbi:FapA family protein [Alkalibacillus silvisoli]|uniref:Flagellar Assembly Protein A N-terminal region domain-containing protein n=1 Tax=Alkalibacillus silvisoli TaxID=392823 RepID=A0ABP3JQI4_9BACI